MFKVGAAARLSVGCHTDDRTGDDMTELMLRFGVAIAIGLLVGLERGWRERDELEGKRVAGIRTFSITGLLGAVIAALSQLSGAPWMLVIGFSVLGALVGWFQFWKASQDEDFSVTVVIAALCVFALGALAVVGDYKVAAAGGAALAGLLASREILHSLLKRLTWPEVRSAVLLAGMTTIVLPLLPNRTIDPWGGLNPHEVWLFTVLTAALSYLGYIAVRMLGPTKGTLITGLSGGIISSTSVTVALAKSAHGVMNAFPLAGGASLAAMVSIIRVCIVVALLKPDLLKIIAPSAIAAALAFGLCGLLLLSFGHAQKADESSLPRNPFDLMQLLIFAAGFAVVSTLSAALVERFGSVSVLASSALSGVFDVDVAVLSAIRLDGAIISTGQVGEAILMAIVANGAGRLSLAMVAGPSRFWLPLSGATLLAAGIGAAVFFVTDFS